MILPCANEGRGFQGMDYYKVLNVPSTAKQIEIDKAYQKIAKAAQYDPTIQMKQVETAYRILSDSNQRAHYDVKAGYAKPGQAGARARSLSKGKGTKYTSDQRVKILSRIAIALFVIAVAYNVLRFGFHLKTFQAGDTLFFKDDNRYFGTIVQIENNHAFGPMNVDAYLIKLPSKETQWFPTSDVKTLCYDRD